MLISKLELSNYRQFDHKIVEFNSTLNVIQGRNGTGKTTVVEAIGFALFGSTMQRGKAKAWIKKGESHGGVKLWIGDFIIERSDTLAIVYDSTGGTLARNNTGIVEWVENTFGLTPDLFRTSFYIGQKDIGSFAALSPLERTKRVEKLLRIDRLDEVKSTVREAARAEQVNITKYQAKLENINLEVVEDRADELVNLRAALEAGIIAHAKYEILFKEWRQFIADKRDWDGIKYDLTSLEAQYLDEVAANAAIEPANRLIREKQRLMKKLANVNVLETYFTMSEREIMNHESTILSIEKLEKQISKAIYEPVEHRAIEADERDLQEMLKILKLNKNIPLDCPTCGQPWPTKAVVNIDKLENKISHARAALNKDEGEHGVFLLTEQRRQFLTPELTWQQLQEASVSLANKADYLRLKELGDVADVLQEEIIIVNIKYAREQEALRARVAVELEEPEAVDVRGYRKSVAFVEANQRDYERYKKDSLIEAEYTELLNDSLSSMEELKKFIKFIDLYRKSFGANVIPLLEKNVSSIVNYLSEGKYTEVKINTDYSIEDFDFYSGSEQDSVSFALRLAISQVSRIGDFKTMLLDEVAASFDTERETLLLEILKLQDTQLIYISHGEI